MSIRGPGRRCTARSGPSSCRERRGSAAVHVDRRLNGFQSTYYMQHPLKTIWNCSPATDPRLLATPPLACDVDRSSRVRCRIRPLRHGLVPGELREDHAGVVNQQALGQICRPRSDPTSRAASSCACRAHPRRARDLVQRYANGFMANNLNDPTTGVPLYSGNYANDGMLVKGLRFLATRSMDAA